MLWKPSEIVGCVFQWHLSFFNCNAKDQIVMVYFSRKGHFETSSAELDTILRRTINSKDGKLGFVDCLIDERY